jgi:hypothetical protein
MDKNEKVKLAVLGGLAIVALALMYKKHGATVVSPLDSVTESPDPFAAPYLQSTPGIFDLSKILNGGTPFQSVINVNVDSGFGATLNEQYMPLFGFVGITSVGTITPTSVSPDVAVMQSSSSSLSAQQTFYNALMASGVSSSNRTAGLTILAAQGFNPYG